MFAVGHISIAYLLGKASGKLLHLKPNIAALMVLSILPDVDIIWDYLWHPIASGTNPFNSCCVCGFRPPLYYLPKKAIPYFLALISHPLIGDFFIGGKVQLFWPLSTAQFGLHELGSYYIDIFNPVNILAEMLLFISAMYVLYRTRDWKVFFSSNKTNLILIIPIATVLLPSTLGYPFSTPLVLTEPTLAFAHLVYLVLFSIAVWKALTVLLKKKFTPSRKPPAVQNASPGPPSTSNSRAESLA